MGKAVESVSEDSEQTDGKRDLARFWAAENETGNLKKYSRLNRILLEV